MAPIAAAEAAAPKGQHDGSAYGTKGNVQVGPLAGQIGTTGFISMPCLGTNGETRSSDIVGASIGANGAVLQAGVVVSTVQTIETDKKTTDEVRSRVAGLNVFGGLISADSVVAVSRTIATRSSLRSEAVGTTFVNLKIAGQSIPVDVAPNFSVALPGVGVVTLNRQQSSGDGASTSALAVDAMVIAVTTANTFGLPVGAELVIGHADSGFQRGLPDITYSGDAYVALVSADVGNVVSAGSGAIALQPLACSGTNGDTKTEKLAAVQLPGLGGTGEAISKAYGYDRVARTTAKVGRISLLGGVVVVKELKSVALTKLRGGRVIRSTEGSTVVGLRVLGLPVLGPITPNMVINLPGIGTLAVNEQIVPGPDSDADTVVNALRITITKKNLLGLPIGANIIVGHAAAGVQRTKSGV
ncbi:MAG: hypothetical protein DI565_03840 [Ancylobacter novellus]|uniref:Uncharacterized protein n=1 Tax=Ancylobacter novellus TaxID=921 RepID=A0A2W5KLC4_ANCNO|nr:MAG: hypothetical protein DI565_03840 [Ancylobacter novellus]